MLRIFPEGININFLGIRKFCYFLSLALAIAGVVSIITHKGLRYGVEFTGGKIITCGFRKKVNIEEIRKIFADKGYRDVSIQEIAGENKFLIRGKKETPISELIQEELKDKEPEIEMVKTIGPMISAELRKRAFWMVFFGIIVMLIYISIRFNFRFGVASILALVHDVIITIGLLSILNKEITPAIMAAILTIIGYSINDSIVLSDRVRENLRFVRKKPIFDIINMSINQVLNRTVITSLTTLFVLITLLIFGGYVIRDFALTLTIGVIVGTYSSIFIVAPIVYEWERLSPSLTRK